MADYTIGGQSYISAREGTKLSIGSALAIENQFVFKNLPNYLPYPQKDSLLMADNHTFYLADGSETDQNITPYELFSFDNVHFGYYFWVNNANVPSGTPPESITNSDLIPNFVAYDDEGIFWRNSGYDLLYETWYDDGTIKGQHSPQELYIQLYATGNGNLYVVNSPTRLEHEEFTLKRYYDYYKPLMIQSGEYSNARSMWWCIQKRSGELITVDQAPKDAESSGTGGGGGSFNNNSIDIPFAQPPHKGFANSGLGRLYHAEDYELEDFSQWLYNPDVIDVIARMWDNPLDLIVSLGIVPIMPTHTEADRTVHIGYTDSGVYMTPITNQYEVLNCGTLNIAEYFGSALDYRSKITIFLPYIGYKELKVDEVMSGSISVMYTVDLSTGSTIAQILCNREGLNSVLYQFEGNVMVQIPLIARDFSQVYQSVVRSSSEMVTSGTGMSVVSGASNSAMNVMASKPLTQKSGSIGASGGFMGIKIPYIIVERPIQSEAITFPQVKGRPSNISEYLYNLSGYTEVEDFISDTLTCTTDEQNEIKELLKTGVIL